MATEVPGAPDVGDRLVMVGVGSTMKATPLLATPETVTTTFPLVAPDGTVATICPVDQLVTEAVVPLKLTVLLPWERPNPDPLIVTEVLTVPEVGERLVILGAAATEKVTMLAHMIIIRATRRTIRITFHTSSSSSTHRCLLRPTAHTQMQGPRN
jgi:hypothetical protein